MYYIRSVGSDDVPYRHKVTHGAGVGAKSGYNLGIHGDL